MLNIFDKVDTIHNIIYYVYRSNLWVKFTQILKIPVTDDMNSLDPQFSIPNPFFGVLKDIFFSIKFIRPLEI